MKIGAPLLALQKVAVDTVMRAALRYRNPATDSEQERRAEP